LQATHDQSNSEQCWFCKDFTAHHTFAAPVEMHAGGFIGKTKNYEVRDTAVLSVPRCERCKLAHERVEGYVAKGGIIGLLIGIVPASLYLQEAGLDSIQDSWKPLLILIAVFGMMGGVFAWRLGRISLPKTIQDQRTREQHPLVQQKVQQGWKIGPKPPGL
jgi:hypothetical protein